MTFGDGTVATKLLQLDTKVTEDFINGIESSSGPTRSTGTHLFLDDHLNSNQVLYFAFGIFL